MCGRVGVGIAGARATARVAGVHTCVANDPEVLVRRHGGAADAGPASDGQDGIKIPESTCAQTSGNTLVSSRAHAAGAPYPSRAQAATGEAMLT